MIKDVKNKIREYLLANPIDRSQKNPYTQAAKKLAISEESVRNIWRTMRAKGMVENSVNYLHTEIPNYKQPSFTVTTTNSGDGAYTYKEARRMDGSVQIEDVVDRKLTDDELFERYGRDPKEWRIISVWFKDKRDGFLLSVHFAPIKVDTDLGLQKEEILKEIRNHSPKSYATTVKEADGEYLYELAIPDLHIGKMSWDKEVGENYDIKIAVKRYKDAIEALLTRVDITQVKKFLLPVGNDMINIDSKANVTTAGTPQSSDSRFGKMFITAKDLLIETIDRLSTIAPVDVVIVAGNHDNLSMFTLGEVLSAWYHNSTSVNVDNSPKQRKYYKYGNTALQFTHGNQEKHLELGLIFATEEPKLWADSKFRFCQLGHYHHSKKIQYTSVQEHQGFQVQIIPSLSGTDSWHYEKGYNAMKQAKGFLFHPKEGLAAECTYTV